MGGKALISGAVAVSAVLFTLALFDTELSAALAPQDPTREGPLLPPREDAPRGPGPGRTQRDPYEHSVPPVAARLPATDTADSAGEAAKAASPPEPPALLAAADTPRMPDAIETPGSEGALEPPSATKGSGRPRLPRDLELLGGKGELSEKAKSERAEQPQAKQDPSLEKPRAQGSPSAPPPGLLTLEVTPPGVQVWIQGRNVGMTPFFKRSLPPGRWTLTLVNAAKKKKRLVVTIRSGEETVIVRSWDRL